VQEGNFRQKKIKNNLKMRNMFHNSFRPFVKAATMGNLAEIKCDQGCKGIVTGCYRHVFSAAKYILSKPGLPLV